MYSIDDFVADRSLSIAAIQFDQMQVLEMVCRMLKSGIGSKAIWSQCSQSRQIMHIHELRRLCDSSITELELGQFSHLFDLKKALIGYGHAIETQTAEIWQWGVFQFMQKTIC